MRVLVTGGAGYIGSVLCPMLLASGHKVTVLDNFRYGQHLALAACCAYEGFELINDDATDARTIAPLVSKADVIIPLAAIVGMPACKRHTREAIDINLDAIKYLVSISRPDHLIIYPNTNSGYGTMPAGSNEPLTEDSPLKGLSEYAGTKNVGEEYVLKHHNSIVFRLATVFGASPRMRTDLLVNDFVLRAVRDKNVVLFDAYARRNYVHVQDVARAFYWAIGKWMGGSLLFDQRVFNLGHDGSNCTKWDLCVKIQKFVPDFSMLISHGNDPDKRDYIISNERLRRAGFEAKGSLDDGIQELIKLYRAFPQYQWGNV